VSRWLSYVHQGSPPPPPAGAGHVLAAISGKNSRLNEHMAITPPAWPRRRGAQRGRRRAQTRRRQTRRSGCPGSARGGPTPAAPLLCLPGQGVSATEPRERERAVKRPGRQVRARDSAAYVLPPRVRRRPQDPAAHALPSTGVLAAVCCPTGSGVGCLVGRRRSLLSRQGHWAPSAPSLMCAGRGQAAAHHAIVVACAPAHAAPLSALGSARARQGSEQRLNQALQPRQPGQQGTPAVSATASAPAPASADCARKGRKGRRAQTAPPNGGQGAGAARWAWAGGARRAAGRRWPPG